MFFLFCFFCGGYSHGSPFPPPSPIPSFRRYNGFFEKGRFEGKGRYRWKVGSAYYGEWVEGKEHGHGQRTNADGSAYDGEWFEGQRHGKGTFAGPPGDDTKYVGAWVNDEQHGYGTCLFADGSVYEGMWQYGVQQGYGEQTEHRSGEVYKGEWVNNIRHGYGILAMKDGTKYEGNFEMGKQDGQATITTAEGVYTGAVAHGVRTGHGTMTYEGGDSYNGDWIRGRRSGMGTFTAADAIYSYVGQWRDNRMHGKGRMVHGGESTILDGEGMLRYVGDFKYGLQHGYATETNADMGVVYKGAYKDGHKNGRATETELQHGVEGAAEPAPKHVLYRKGVLNDKDQRDVERAAAVNNKKKTFNLEAVQKRQAKTTRLEAARAEASEASANTIVDEYIRLREAIEAPAKAALDAAEEQHDEL